MARNEKYIPVQIPKEAYELLKEYCDKNGLKLGGYLAVLIKRNCSENDKKPPGKVLQAIRIPQ